MKTISRMLMLLVLVTALGGITVSAARAQTVDPSVLLDQMEDLTSRISDMAGTDYNSTVHSQMQAELAGLQYNINAMPDELQDTLNDQLDGLRSNFYDSINRQLAMTDLSTVTTGGHGSSILSQVVMTCETRRNMIIADEAVNGDGVWITEALVDCVRHTIRNAFAYFISALYPKISAIVSAAITLTIAIFGVMLAGGMVEKASRDSFVILFKVACVMYFVQTGTVMWIYDSAQGAMDELTDAVFRFGTTAATDDICRPDGAGGYMPFAANQNTIWDRVDCMADFIIGIKGASVDGAGVSEGAGEAGISRGLIFFFMSNLASPGTGFFIGVMGIYVLWSFVMAMIKALHTYLASILAISFILLLAPLFFPLLLFKKTRQYFDKWYRMLGSFILQPVILFAFLSMMMIALDYMLVSGRYSVLNAACGEVCVMDGSAVSNPERLNRHLESSGALGETGMRQDVVLTDNYAHIGGLNNERQGMVEGLVRDGSADRPSDTDNGALVTGRAFTELKYDALAAVMGDGAPEDRKIAVMLAMVLLTLTMFVFLSFLNYIPVLATDITGGMFEVPNLANEVGNHIPMGTQIEQASRQISDSVRGRGSSQMADYTRRMGEMLGMR